MPALDLDRYLARIGCPDVRPAATLESLATLQAAHALSIPFENLDIQMGRGVELAIEALVAKLVGQRRGGYCFEQNSLWLAVLQAIGFDARAADARVRIGEAPAARPRTHMTLVVTIGGMPWLADVGFGPQGPLGPVPMDGAAHVIVGREFRVLAGPDAAAVLQARDAGAWIDLYASDLTACHPADIAMANWFTSTWPQSPFVTSLVAQRSLRGGSHVLRNLTYTHTEGGASTTREVDRADLVALLDEVFDIEVPADATFRGVDGGG